MVNLFRQAGADQGSLTAALIALLEHSDRDMLNGLFRRAGLPPQAPPGVDLAFAVTDDGSAGLVSGPHFQVRLVAEGPGAPEYLQVPADPAQETLYISVAGRAPAEGHALTWEQVDRWLAAAAEQHDPQSRTGFLVRQFQEFLRESGIPYFPGFAAAQLEQVPVALQTLAEFFRQAECFYDQAGAAGAVEIRRSRPDDLLAGYLYRDYTRPDLSAPSFLRVAFHLPQRELQVAAWIAPTNEAGPHARLRNALMHDTAFRSRLQRLPATPLLWLWSPEGEHRLPLAELDPESLTGLDWPRYQAALQSGIPFPQIAGEGLVQRTSALVDAITTALAPILSGPVH